MTHRELGDSNLHRFYSTRPLDVDSQWFGVLNSLPEISPVGLRVPSISCIVVRFERISRESLIALSQLEEWYELRLQVVNLGLASKWVAKLPEPHTILHKIDFVTI